MLVFLFLVYVLQLSLNEVSWLESWITSAYRQRNCIIFLLFYVHTEAYLKMFLSENMKNNSSENATLYWMQVCIFLLVKKWG